MTTWLPTAPLEHLQARAATMASVRAFFAARDVLEVETPLLSSAMNSDPNIASVTAQQMGRTYYLNTSPEFPMKRLLAAGYGAIYQFAKVFRAGEAGRRHNPEFTMLEWYRPGYDDVAMRAEVHALLVTLIPGLPRLDFTYEAAFKHFAGFDPHRIPLADLQAQTHARFEWSSAVRNEMLDCWLAQVVEPALPQDHLTFITDWPADMAALAQVTENAGGWPVARRFEAFYRGMEMANGYFELRDADAQRARFEADLARRAELNLPVGPLDEHLDAALKAGLPECAGVAMGFDRLMMVLLGENDISRVISFPMNRA